MRLKGDEKGFSLIEVLVVVAILGAIMGVMAMTINTIPKVSGESNDRALALRQVQNAGYWISRDTQMAQSVIADNLTSPKFLIFKWTEWDIGGTESIYHAVTYNLEDMPGGMKKLMRNHQDSLMPEEEILIAEYIYYNPGDAETTEVIDYQNPALEVRITAIYGDATISRDYEASRRPTF